MRSMGDILAEGRKKKEVGGERITVKFVAKANMWCKSTFTKTTDGKTKQTQEWFKEEPKLT